MSTYHAAISIPWCVRNQEALRCDREPGNAEMSDLVKGGERAKSMQPLCLSSGAQGVRKKVSTLEVDNLQLFKEEMTSNGSRQDLNVPIRISVNFYKIIENFSHFQKG